MLALDKSLRSLDADGHMRVEMSRISKANICPYFGREIPRWQELGLDPDKTYRLFRDPRELEKGAHTFDGKPLLIRHVAVSGDEPQQSLIVGSVGVCSFEPPYLVTRPLTFWTTEARELIETDQQRELSAAYRYDAEMIPGTWGGQQYDGRMVNIRGNHVAIVSEGRAGPDVHVADELPTELRKMPLKNAALIERLQPFLKPDADLMALDSSLGETPAVSVEKLSADEMKAACDEALEEKRKEHGEDAELSDEEKEKAYEKARDKKAKDAKHGKDKAKDSKHGKDAKHGKDSAGKNVSQNMSGDGDVDHRKDFEPAKDSITGDEMQAAIKAASDKIRADARAAAQAREAVRPIVGAVSIAMDSADEIYAFALEKAGVKVKDVHPSAYPALIELALANRSAKTSVAMDASPAASDLDSLLGLRAA